MRSDLTLHQVLDLVTQEPAAEPPTPHWEPRTPRLHRKPAL